MLDIVAVNEQGEPVTTSAAIADGTARAHHGMIQLIRENLNDFKEFGGVAFEMRPFDTAGGRQTREVAVLNEHQATLLITFMRNTGIVKEFKIRLVKAFFDMRDELRNQAAPALPDFANPAEAARAWADQHDKCIEAQQQIERDAPDVAFAREVKVAEDAITVAKAAKILGTGQRRLMAYLRQIGWVTRRNEPYQAKIEAGYLDVKLGSWQHPDHGLQQSVTTLITGKGLAKLRHMRESLSRQIA